MYAFVRREILLFKTQLLQGMTESGAGRVSESQAKALTDDLKMLLVMLFCM